MSMIGKRVVDLGGLKLERFEKADRLAGDRRAHRAASRHQHSRKRHQGRPAESH
jgi:hypothetical protein